MSLICAALVHFLLLRPEASAEHNTPPGTCVDSYRRHHYQDCRQTGPGVYTGAARPSVSDAVTDNSRPSLPGKLSNIKRL